MDNTTEQVKEYLPDVGKESCVTIKSNDLIDILKTLEGIKRKLQPLLTKNK